MGLRLARNVEVGGASRVAGDRGGAIHGQCSSTGVAGADVTWAGIAIFAVNIFGLWTKRDRLVSHGGASRDERAILGISIIWVLILQGFSKSFATTMIFQMIF